MTAIWQQAGEGWQLLKAAGFPDEATLHAVVERSPMLLPLAGQPQLAVVGREVALGGNYADVIALETTGRPVVIEVKLAKSAESRRAVVAQVLAYAAFLHTLTVEQLESDILGPQLRSRNFVSLSQAVQAVDQEGSFDEGGFRQALAEHLAAGSFRLVLVLDSAPEELIRLVGYLEAMTEKLVIDLVTVAAFDIGGSTILVPQRVDPERVDSPRGPTRIPAARGRLSDGPADFTASIPRAVDDEKPILERLARWAAELEQKGFARLFSFKGARDEVILLPKLQPDNVGLVTIWNDGGRAHLAVWKTVFDRKAPNSVLPVETLIAPLRIGQGNYISPITEPLLEALTAAYAEASGSLEAEA